jgi:hypothetical protein
VWVRKGVAEIVPTVGEPSQAVCDKKILEFKSKRQFRQVDQLLNFLERLPGRFEACFEASCSYGGCYDLL